jgi:hypothetical protein
MLTMPIVTRNGWILNVVIITPFKKPIKAPSRKPAKRITGIGILNENNFATITQTNASIPPIERSMPPVSSTIVIPKATIAMLADWFMILEILIFVRKLGLKEENIIIIPINPRNVAICGFFCSNRFILRKKVRSDATVSYSYLEPISKFPPSYLWHVVPPYQKR